MRLILCLLCLKIALIAGSLEVDISAPSAILMNADTGAVLFEKEAHALRHPASTTKIATALFILSQDLDLNQIATVRKEALKHKSRDGQSLPWWLELDGTMMQIKAGEKLNLDALLHGLMLVSGNDAANVIAEHVGGTVPQFMEELNSYLANMGCKNTHFNNPHGLFDLTHLSTAYDLAVITAKALKIPKFRKLVSTLSYAMPETNKQPQRELKLTNPLMKPGSRYYYPKAIGVKTGYIEAAKYNMVAAAEHEGRTLIAVLLGCEKRGERFEGAKRLFEAAFSETKASRRLVGPEHVFTKEMRGAKLPLKASLMTPLAITFFPSEEPACKAALHWNVQQLPVIKGQKVGEIHILDEKNHFLGKGDLIALETLKGNFFFSLKERILQMVSFRE